MIGCGSGSWQRDSTGTSLPSFTAASRGKSPNRTRPAPAKARLRRKSALSERIDPFTGIMIRLPCSNIGHCTRAREASELQAIVPGEISGLLRHAVAVQISWAAGDDASDFTEANRDQPAVAKRPDPDRDVDLIGDRTDAVIAHGKIDGDFRKSGP